jgi:AraC-like DNA-binding protein
VRGASASSSSSPPSSTASPTIPAVRVEAPATGPLTGFGRYYGFLERAAAPVHRREGPGVDVILLVSFGNEWSIDGTRLTSFAAGLHDQQVTTRHDGWSHGLQVNLAPPLARTILGVPLETLAQRVVPLEDVFADGQLPERLHGVPSWRERFRIVDDVLRRRAAAPSRELLWAWRRLTATHGRVAIATLAAELGWSRKRMAARFRDEIGVTPKTFARLLRFERARTLAEAVARPDWTRLAVECGYYDQSHLINDFRSISGRTPETFFQDNAAAAA